MADWSVLGVGRINKKNMLNSGVSATKNEKLLVMVFQQQKGKGETIAGWSCFIDKNGEEMGKSGKKVAEP
jgi:hypothetical protein